MSGTVDAALYDLRPAAETVDFVMDRRSSGFEPEPLPLGFPPERQAGVPHERVRSQPGRLPTVDALLHNSGRVTDRSQSCLNAIEFALTQACPGLTYDSVPHI